MTAPTISPTRTAPSAGCFHNAAAPTDPLRNWAFALLVSPNSCILCTVFYSLCIFLTVFGVQIGQILRSDIWIVHTSSSRAANDAGFHLAGGHTHGFGSFGRGNQGDTQLGHERRARHAYAHAGQGHLWRSACSTTRSSKPACPKPVYKSLRDTMTRRRPARHFHRRRGGVGAARLGGGERRIAFHALVPAAHRHHRGKARRLLRTNRGWPGAGRVQRQGAGARRARCLELPVRRHAQHLRSARLYRVGSDQPAVAAREQQQRHARHPHRVRELDRRGARQEDAAAPLDGSALGAGRARVEAVRIERHPRHRHVRSRAGVLPDRQQLLFRAARSAQRRPHALRRPSAEGPGARRSVLRIDSRARARVHGRSRIGALQVRRADQDAPQRSGAVAVRGGADLRERQRRHRSPDDDDGDA